MPSINLNGYANGTWTKDNVKFNLSSTDATSGIEKYQLYDNHGYWYDVSAEFIQSTDTWLAWQFRAVDKAGNVSELSDVVYVNIDKTAPGTTAVTYNSGSNAAVWQNNYNITLNASDNIGVSYYQIDWNSDGVVDTTSTSNFIPWNNWESGVTRFRAVDNAGNVGEWTDNHNIFMDTEAPVHTNWWWGEVTKDVARLYIQATDNVGLMSPAGQYNGHNAGIFCPTSTASGGQANWYWFPATWDSSANAYRCDITPSTFGHYGETYTTHLYMYDYAGNGGMYAYTSVEIPALSNYVTFTGQFKNSLGTFDQTSYVANNLYYYGTVYSSWYNDTGSAKSVTITIQNRYKQDGNSGAAIYVNTQADFANGFVFRLEHDDWYTYGTTTQTVTVPAGYYLQWFNQWDAETIITAIIN